MNRSYILTIFLLVVQISFSQSLESKIDALITSNYTPNEPGISILVAKNGVPIYQKAFGKANLELATPMTINNVFQIGSITKQFTAVAILMLEEQGKLQLNDNIQKFIPDYPTAGNTITIHHLLNHTSGIKNSTPVGKQGAISKTDMTPDELINYFKNTPLNFTPGNSFKYSNAGYIILGRIIEVVSRQSYSQFIEQQIFNKLNMSSSSYGNMKSIIKNRIPGYQMEQNTFVNADYMSLTLPYSAGSILSTVNDLLLWQNALNTNNLIKQSTFKKAITPTILNNGKTIPYGYGFRIATIADSHVIAHTGSTKGFKAIALFLPKEQIYIVALTNCNCKNINEISKKIATLAIDKPSSDNPSLKKSDSHSQESLKQFIGTYRVKANANITIGMEDGHLFLIAPGQTKKIELFPENDFLFYMNVSNAKVNFNSNDHNEIISLTLLQSGRQVLATKI